MQIADEVPEGSVAGKVPVQIAETVPGQIADEVLEGSDG